tara:strand:+ start:67 stop:417 length:351 start_codon:yes stop_codon:yes gene_type:complete
MWKPIFAYTGIYVMLFVSHILSGAYDYDLLFRVIVSIITIQTIFAGYILHLLGGNASHARFPLVGLSFGLGWAYADMKLEFSILIWVFLAVIIQILTEKGLKYIPSTENINGRQSN